MKILILGGYGTVGRNLTKIILENTDYKIVLFGRDYKKLNQVSKEFKKDFNRIDIVCADIKDLKDNFDCNIIINASSSLDLQESILSKIKEFDCDYFDVHSPSKTNYFLKNKYTSEIKNKTWLFDCGATSFIPFLSLLTVSSDLYVNSLYKIYWEDKNLSNQTVIEYDNILYENVTEDSLYFDNKWWAEKDCPQKETVFGESKCTFNGEIKLVLEKNSAIKEIGFYVRTENLKEKIDEITKVTIITGNSSVSFFHEDGWYMTAAIIFSIIEEHIKNKKPGVYFSGEYVNPESHIQRLKALNISIEVKNGNN